MTTTTTTTRPDGSRCWGCGGRARNVLPHPSRTQADWTAEAFSAAVSRWIDSHFCTQACADRFDRHVWAAARRRQAA